MCTRYIYTYRMRLALFPRVRDKKVKEGMYYNYKRSLSEISKIIAGHALHS